MTEWLGNSNRRIPVSPPYIPFRFWQLSYYCALFQPFSTWFTCHVDLVSCLEQLLGKLLVFCFFFNFQNLILLKSTGHFGFSDASSWLTSGSRSYIGISWNQCYLPLIMSRQVSDNFNFCISDDALIKLVLSRSLSFHKVLAPFQLTSLLWGRCLKTIKSSFFTRFTM